MARSETFGGSSDISTNVASTITGCSQRREPENEAKDAFLIGSQDRFIDPKAISDEFQPQKCAYFTPSVNAFQLLYFPISFNGTSNVTQITACWQGFATTKLPGQL